MIGAAGSHDSETFEIDVERGKVREFARATLSRNPAYLDGRRPVSPATFLMTTAFWGRTPRRPRAAATGPRSPSAGFRKRKTRRTRASNPSPTGW